MSDDTQKRSREAIQADILLVSISVSKKLTSECDAIIALDSATHKLGLARKRLKELQQELERLQKELDDA